METGIIYQGHALDVLPTLPNNCIDFIGTSPPYWQLRVYPADPVIWDEGPTCEHEWAESVGAKTKLSSSGNTQEITEKYRRGSAPTSHFCVHCDAWLGSLGLEPTIALYIKHLCDVGDELYRVLNDTGTAWFVIGDTFYGSGAGHEDTGKLSCYPDESLAIHRGKGTLGDELQKKCMCQIPQRFEIEMVKRGWILRHRVIWHKPNCIPTSKKDGFTLDYEFVFGFVKKPVYSFEQQFEPAITKDGIGPWPATGGKKYAHMEKFSGEPSERRERRNMRSVWSIPTMPIPEYSHVAPFPEKLIEIPIRATCPIDGIGLDPFVGSGTTLAVLKRMSRQWIGIELSQEYVEMAYSRIAKTSQGARKVFA